MAILLLAIPPRTYPSAAPSSSQPIGFRGSRDATSAPTEANDRRNNTNTMRTKYWLGPPWAPDPNPTPGTRWIRNPPSTSTQREPAIQAGALALPPPVPLIPELCALRPRSGKGGGCKENPEPPLRWLWASTTSRDGLAHRGSAASAAASGPAGSLGAERLPGAKPYGTLCGPGSRRDGARVDDAASARPAFPGRPAVIGAAVDAAHPAVCSHGSRAFPASPAHTCQASSSWVRSTRA